MQSSDWSLRGYRPFMKLLFQHEIDQSPSLFANELRELTQNFHFIVFKFAKEK